MNFERLAPEQHDSLPGIAEPAENPVLLGHDEAMQRLTAAFLRGRLHHALLLHGPRGIGKATFAFHLARRILAGPGEAGKAAEGTQLFRQIAIGAHPALLHLTRPLDRDGKKFRTAITVDEVRRIGTLLSHTAHDRGFRIVIIDPAEDMNHAAANALLKNLEEPPPNSLFMLISHRPGALLSTLRSRCQAIRLLPLAPEMVAELVAGSGMDRAAARKLAAESAGSPRNALLLALNGGLEIAAAVEEILTSQPFDMEKAHRLGDAVSGRDNEPRLDLLNAYLLDRIVQGALHAGEAGAIEQAARLAELWQRTNEAMRTADTYHLDRKQLIVSTLLEIRAALPSAG